MIDHSSEIKKLSTAIKKIRKYRNMNQTDFGGLIGVKKSVVSRLENSIGDIRVSTLLRIAEALNMDVVISRGGIEIKIIV